MHICLLCVEIFAWGKYGGFGRATRMLGAELVRRGVEVSVVVPRRGDQSPVEELDGMTVYGFPSHSPMSAADLCRECDADVYHSHEPSWSTVMARRAMPRRKHVVTFVDPRNARDWWIEFSQPSASRLQVLANLVYEDNPWVRAASRRADAHFCAADDLKQKVMRKYRLAREPGFLPDPVDVPSALRKSSTPTVCYVARLDRRKRPELFLELARRFPDVRFLMVGKSRDAEYEAALRRRYEDLPNLEMLGFIDQFSSDRLSRILGESWILANTASREGLPNAFIEAAAHRTAILSAVNPDGFASRFGVAVQNDDFASGLEALLRNDRWRELGEKGHTEVCENFETARVVDRHIAAYRTLLGDSRRAVKLG